MAISYIRSNPLNALPTNKVPQALAEQLGSGLATPLRIDNNSQWAITAGPEKIQQDIYICLATPVGRRLDQPDFGSLLHRYIFEVYTPLLAQELIIATQTSLNTWMGAVINVTNVTIDPSNLAQHYLTLVVQYTIKGTVASQSINILLATNDKVVLPPETFHISGIPVFKT